MKRSSRFALFLCALVWGPLLVACNPGAELATPSTTSLTTTALGQPRPSIEGIELNHPQLGNYELLEITVGLSAEFGNPYDVRQVSLDAVFDGPASEQMKVPGFWDGRGNWKIRFTPSAVGQWSYTISVTDSRGVSEPRMGEFSVAESDRHGWLQVGSWVNPSYSSHYLAFHDGTPWYGRGHADLQMTLGGLQPDGGGFRLFNEMPAAGENYVMWWPMWANNFMARSYSDYSFAQSELIDLALQDAEEKDATIVYTIWTHQHLRTNNHRWDQGKWLENGFSRLTDVAGFFTDEEAWAWQENHYRYTIARWGHSTVIAMWQTITEINGTEAYEHADPWHERLNAYFQANDPYLHPTTATQSGSVDWPTAHRLMDVPQMHVYEFVQDRSSRPEDGDVDRSHVEPRGKAQLGGGVW